MITSLPSRVQAWPRPATADVRRLSAKQSPVALIRTLRATPGLVVLHGEWAGGGTMISTRPFATLTETSEIFAAFSEELRWSSGSSVVGGGWFGWLSYPDSSSWR